MSRHEAYFHGSGVVLCAAVYTFTHHPYFFGVMHMGMKLRVANCSLVYRSNIKVFFLSLVLLPM